MTDALTISLLPHQLHFLQAKEPFVALVGGFGCGKSFALGAKAHQLASLNYGYDGALISRSHKQLHDFLLPEVLKYWDMVHATYRLKDGNKLLLTYGGKPSVIHLLTTENEAYKRWAGGNLAWALVDEIDTMPHADEVWSYIGDRVRVTSPRKQICCASTPEGFGFLYDYFDKQVRDDPTLKRQRRLIRGNTLDNPHLDTGYVERQIQTRNPVALKAYIYGEFCNLEGSLVYHRYDPSYEGNHTKKTLADFPSDMPLHIGCDFNANINATIVHVIVNNTMYAVKEIYGHRTFDEVIEQVKTDYGNRQCYWYPDATHFENVELLRRAFGTQNVIFTGGNPRVKKRVASLHMRIMNPVTGERHYLVNPNTCPHLAHGLANQPLDARGDPDKRGGLDHSNDAAGYAVHHRFPFIERQPMGIVAL